MNLTGPVVFETPFFQVRALEGYGPAGDLPYYCVELPDYVTVLATTEAGEYLLVRQYRPTQGENTLEMPAGIVDPGEAPETSARRELEEETGYTADTLELLGCIPPDVGRLANKMWCYRASGCRPLEGATAEPGIETLVCTPAQVQAHLASGDLDHALNLAVLLLGALKGGLPGIDLQGGAP